jgi:predicted dehydrogenase
MDSINVACVGVGYWGKNLVRNFYNLSDCELKICCDLSSDNLAKVKEGYPGVSVTDRFDDVINDPTIDAVVIASPAPHHHRMAKQALEAGKHVYVEKPLTLNAEHARDLCETADARDRTLMVGHLMEYHPAVGKLKELVDSGELGDIYYLYAQRLNLGIIRQDENAFWSLAPHDVSIALYLLGEEPDSVSARGESFLQPGIEDVVFCNLRFPSGAMANIHVSWLDPHRSRQVTLVGSEKMAVFNDIEATEKVRIYDKGVEDAGYASYGDALTLRQGDITIPRIEMVEPLRAECAHFLNSIATGNTPRSDGYDGLRVVRVLEAAEQSLANGGNPVELSK